MCVLFEACLRSVLTFKSSWCVYYDARVGWKQRTAPLSVTRTWHIALSLFAFRLPLVKSQSFCEVWRGGLLLRLSDPAEESFLPLFILIFGLIFVRKTSRYRVSHLPRRHNMRASRPTSRRTTTTPIMQLVNLIDIQGNPLNCVLSFILLKSVWTGLRI